MARRISRAKQRVSESHVPFRLPPGAELPGRLAAVLQVLYLIFNEGYAATGGRTSNAPTCRPRRSGSHACCTLCCLTTPRWPGCSP